MSARTRRIYWDSACYIAILKGELAYLEDLRKTWEDATRGAVEIVASTLCISEAVRPPYSDVIPRAESEEKVRRFFEHGCIKLRMHDRDIAEIGRELCWNHNLKAR